MIYYTNNGFLLDKKKNIILLSFIPFLTILSGLTNFQFGLLWSVIPSSSDYGSILIYNPNIMLLIYFVYCIIAILLSISLTISYLRKVSTDFKKPAIILIIATIIPILAASLKIINWNNTINPIPIGYLISLILFSIVIFYYKGLDVIPLVQESFINDISTGLMFFDKFNILIKINNACKHININSEDLNTKIDKIFENNPEMIKFISSDEKTKILEYNLENIANPKENNTKQQNIANPKENKLEKSLNTKNLWLKVSKRTMLKNNEIYGTIITLTNITDLKTAENEAILRQKEVEIYNKNLSQTNQKLDETINSLNIANKELDETVQNLDKSNREKAVLIKEVHHRVKNNLQIITSLLNLDERFHKGREDLIIESTKNRINTMALIHEKTYKSDDLAYINAKSFIDTNVKNLINLYDINKEIKLKLNIDEDINLPMGIITPLGLIINELFTNSIKYAFDSDENKAICLNLKRKDKLCIFELIDNGKGLPEDIDIYKSPSLGLTIVNSLTAQLEGTFSKIDVKGAGFRIEFPIDENFWSHKTENMTD